MIIPAIRSNGTKVKILTAKIKAISTGYNRINLKTESRLGTNFPEGWKPTSGSNSNT